MFTIPAPNSVALKLFSFPIYKYGIVLALAILIGIVISNRFYNLFCSKKDILIEYAPLMIIAGILGARLYFCMLNPHFYLSHPLEILNIRHGGLSVHGAILGGILSIIYISKRTKQSFLGLTDALSCGTLFGQAIGRWGNYFNSEAFGLPVSGQNWGLFIPETQRPVEFAQFSLFHPTFLYESVLDFGGFFILAFLILHFGKKYKGLTFFSYLVIYSVIRFFIEQIRLDSALNIGSIPVAQVVSVILFICGIVGIFYILFKKSLEL